MTALDNLFEHTTCPFKAEQSACRWLCLLAETGYDVHQYLEWEQHQHSSSGQLSRGMIGRNEMRQLIIDADFSSARWSVVSPFRHGEWKFNRESWSDPFDASSQSPEHSFAEVWQKKKAIVKGQLTRQARKEYPEYFGKPDETSRLPGAWVDEDDDT